MDIYFKSIFMHIKSAMQYKKSFIIIAIGGFITTFLSIFGIYLLFQKFGVIKNWTFYDIALTFGISMFCHSFTEMFGRGFDLFSDMVRTGEFDRVLIRPRDTALQVACSNFELNKIGRFLQSILTLVIAICNINVEWNFYKALVLFFMILGGCAIFLGILIVKATFSFWTVDALEFMNIFSDGGKEMAQYPVNIYEDWFRFIFTFLLPFGLVNYYPLLFLLDKNDSIPWFYGFFPLVAVLFILPCLLFWRVGVRHYKSTGS